MARSDDFKHLLTKQMFNKCQNFLIHHHIHGDFTSGKSVIPTVYDNIFTHKFLWNLNINEQTLSTYYNITKWTVHDPYSKLSNS